MDQRIMENYCEGEIQLEDSIEKLRKLLDQREKDRENSNISGELLIRFSKI